MAGNDLLGKLNAYKLTGPYPLHMPGHKRNETLLGGALPWGLDITEIDGFDNLQAPSGLLKDLAADMAALWGSDRAYPLVGGSTAGILAAIYAAVSPGDRVLVARNCHQSVYHALELMDLKPVYLTPPTVEAAGIYGSVAPEQVAAALEMYDDLRLAVITSPTYEGMLSDVQTIGALLHERHVPLLVDEAHGAHLGLFPGFPVGAAPAGGDLVVQSLHKTLPALNQAAVLHVRGGYVDPGRVRHAVNLFQTSSPSYPVLASMDCCVALLRERGQALFHDWKRRLTVFDQRCEGLRHLSMFRSGNGVFDRDPGKILILSPGLSGKELSGRLRERFGLALEMAGPASALAMTSICDTDEALERFAEALLQIDRELPVATDLSVMGVLPPEEVEMGMGIGEAVRAAGRRVKLANALGCISREYIRVYPPGIPAVLPGQRITRETLRHLETVDAMHLDVLCGGHEWDGHLSVVIE